MLGYWNRLDRRGRLIATYLAISAIAFVGYFELPLPWSAICYLLMSGLAVYGLIVGVRLNSPRAIEPWAMLALAQSAFLVGDLVWFAAFVPTEVAPVSPHTSDAFYLTGYPVLALGVLLFIRARQPRYRLTAAIDALLIGLAAVLVVWQLAIEGFVHDETLPATERFVLLAYPIGDVLILAAAAYLLLSGRQAKGAFYLLVASLAALLMGDVLLPLIPDEALATDLSDAFLLTSYVLFGLTALVPSMRNLTEPSDAPTAPENSGRLILIGACLATLPVFAIYQRFFMDHQDLAVVGVAGLVALVAILLRMRELSSVHKRLESRYASLLANASDAFAIVGTDGRLTYASPASKRILGYEPARLAGRAAIEFVHPSAASEAINVIRNVSEKAGNQLETQLRMQRADGEWRWLSIIATNRTDDPEVGGIVLNFRDVTDKHEDEHRLDLQARVLDEVQHAVLVTNSAGNVTYWNHAAETLLGWSAEDVLGRSLLDIGLMPDTESSRGFVTRLREGKVSGEHELRRRDGGRVTALITNSAMRDEAGKDGGSIAVAVDISDRKQLEQRLQAQAFTDSLTGLANRALFHDRVDHVLAKRSRGGHVPTPAVLFLDVDDFKTVNDSMGHTAGDALLKQLANRLISVVRPSDTAARLGGDEFAILLEDATQDEAEGVAQRLHAALAVPVKVGDREVKISASIGIAVPDGTSGTTSESLLRNADLAMYRAKARVQGSYAVYQPGMHEAALRRLELKADLQQAIENDGLVLDYQPIFRLDSGQAVAAEALLRWTHPERGPIPAVETLALAEATGLMMPLGGWVLERACREISRWRDELGHAADSVFLCVNASARELLDPGYADLVAANLSRAKLPAEALAIEITESDLMQESESAINALNKLKDLGVRLAVDDFGTGYSSLAYLARFPLDILKVDRTFVSSRVRTQDGQIARAIVDLARSLGLQVIAEGIEREEDRQLMDTLGAQLGQGFYLARPTSGDGVLSVFRRESTVKRRATRRAVAAEVSPATS